MPKETDDTGAVRGMRDGEVLWESYTSGSINFPPAIWNDRVFVGSNDGRVYAFEALSGRLLWQICRILASK